MRNTAANKSAINNIAPSVWVIIVNWNNLSDLQECLSSLEKVDYSNFFVLVVDNGSTDGSARYLHEQTGIDCLFLSTNEGFVGGNNQGIEYAVKQDADFVLLLNNDTIVDPSFISQLINEVQHNPEVGIAGPLICYASDSTVVWSAGGRIDKIRGETSMVGIGEDRKNYDLKQPYQVDFVTGCAMLVRRQVIEDIGLLDTRFFAYYEETEYCYRASKKGWKCLIVPSALIWHKISPEVRASSESVHYYMTRNRLLFIRSAKLGFSAYLNALMEDLRTYLSWSLKSKWRSQKRLRKAHIQAVLDNFLNRWGKKSFQTK